MLYISNMYKYKRRSDIESETVESIWIEVFPPHRKSFLLCSVYRPPSASTDWADNFAEEINNATSCHDIEVLLAGDLNIDYKKEVPRFWINTLERFDLSQLVKTPTRVTAKSDTLIDHIYTNKPENICEIIVPYLALSDHYPVCVTRQFPKSEQKRKHVEVQYRDFKNINEAQFRTDLLYTDFNSIDNIDDTADAFTKFYELFFNTLDNHAQCKTKRVKSQLKPS